MLIKIYDGCLFLRYGNKVRSRDCLLYQRCGLSSRFIRTAGICTERLPRAQVFCVLGDSQVWLKEESGEAEEKGSLLYSHVLERLSLYTEGDQMRGNAKGAGSAKQVGNREREDSWAHEFIGGSGWSTQEKT